MGPSKNDRTVERDQADAPSAIKGFKDISSRYDAWYELPAHRLIDAVEKRTVRGYLPKGPEGALLLDMGAGTGHWMSLERAAGYTVVGLDRSRAMLEVAASKTGTGRFLVQGDAHRLPLPDAVFDGVVSITTLEFVQDPPMAIREMLRCLKPGGVLVIGVLNAFSYLGLKRRLFPGSTFRGAHFFTVGELKRLLAGAGLVSFATCAFMPPWNWLVPMGKALEDAGKLLTPMIGSLIVAQLRKPGGGRKTVQDKRPDRAAP
jgi:ubiquinone/menaquinone biosynthesis C-methylase UbiE